MTNHKVSLLLYLAALPLLAHADEFERSELGLRIGISDENRADVNSYEIIATLESPWSREISDSLELDLEFDFGLGALDGEGETGVLAHAGPKLEFEFGDFPLELVISSGPALLSEHEFDNLDLGGSFQFVSAVGLDLEVAEEWTLAYRYLHISNAGIHDENPGMNLHAINLLYSF